MTIASIIIAAPNAKTVNAILESGMAIVNQGRGCWAFTVNGDVVASGDFADIKRAAAKYVSA